MPSEVLPAREEHKKDYALYIVSKNASATCPTIVDPTGLDWPSPARREACQFTQTQPFAEEFATYRKA